MNKYAFIIIDISQGKLDRPFTYRIPDRLRDEVKPGSLVEVPFGMGNSLRKGYVVGFTGRCDLPEDRIKEILRVLNKNASFTDEKDTAAQKSVALAAWMKERYGSTMITALKTVLTARKAAAPVRSRKIILLLTPEEVREKLSYYTAKHQVARARLLESLAEDPEQPYQLILSKLHINAQTILAMQKQGILRVEVTESLRNPVSFTDVQARQIQLSAEQQHIVDSITADFDAGLHSVSLIHGITGSGKTEVYISIIENIVKRGRQAIMLIPEISLTYQTLIRFYRHFGDRVTVMNSTLSESEKSDQFERARRGEIDVIIGPRSALFTPFPSIGVIVIDEEHEASYKNEGMPKYHALDTAMVIASLHGAVTVLGSATPSLTSYYRAQKGEFRLYEMSRRLTGGTLAEVTIADMKEELRKGNRTILSAKLRSLLEDRMNRGEQTMLFLNRRGYSGFVSCRSCGHVMKCPHCDVSLSLHRNNRLVCHYCGYEEPAVSKCPECGSPYISGFRAGTEQIEEYIRKCYPKARVLRMDADTTSAKGSYEKILSSFANEEADILIGTQMIVKGHDFPKVTLVGILLADLSLYANDYRAAERTFQLLTQAAGRAGRGSSPGNVVIQTYEPENYAIVHAAAQDYKGFYQDEIKYRELLGYPPVRHMLAIQISSQNDDHAQMCAGLIREKIGTVRASSENAREDLMGDLLVIGPASAMIGRLKDDYRYVIYVKSEKYDTLIGCKDIVEAMKEKWIIDNTYTDVGIQFDFDPINPY